jgi:hypothetical protein
MMLKGYLAAFIGSTGKNVAASSDKILKTLSAKYRISRNTYACCRLDILHSDEENAKVLVGVLLKGDRELPVGTQLIIPAADQNMEYKTALVQNVDGEHIHLCTPFITQPIKEERRKLPRYETNFKMMLKGHQLDAVEGTFQGITFQCNDSKNTLTNLLVGRTYDFKASYKQQDYEFPGTLIHLHYDWKYYRHRLGVHFKDLDEERETIMKFLVDPNYKIPIAQSSNIDPSSGKISL